MHTIKLSLLFALVVAGCSSADRSTDETRAQSQDQALLDGPSVGDLDPDCYDECVESFGKTSSPAAQRALEKSCRNSCTR